MTTIFICYGRENQERVRALARDLQDLGREVWFDQELTGGQVWWNKILRRIRECDVFALALSSDSLESQACTREYSYAIKLGKTILPVAVKVEYLGWQAAGLLVYIFLVISSS